MQATPIESAAPSYRLAVADVAARVRATTDGVVLADSGGAKVMHETGLPSYCYFPPADVAEQYLEPSNRRTFCPFKGTASYWHLALPERTIENAVWSYQRPLDEATETAGYLAFFDDVVALQAIDGELPRTPTDEPISGPLVDWLLLKAWQCPSAAELTGELGRQMLAAGIPVWRLGVGIWTLHPQLAGRSYTWRHDTDSVEEGGTPHGMLLEPVYLNSPVRHVSEGLGGVRQRLDQDEAEFSFPIMQTLREQGGTDYVAMPLPFSDGQINTLTLTSDRPEGFSTNDLGSVYQCFAIISRYYETLTLRHNTSVLLETYLGRRSGQRVLKGQTQRGDGEEIRAAILYCDLRESTQLAASLSRGDYLDLLNDFFECATRPVLSRGGEVLKFIGDAVLAAFPVEQDDGLACGLARDAALEIVGDLAKLGNGDGDGDGALQCAIGVHLGEVTFGNVGGRERLDFTVIGSAANLATRLSEQCKILSRPLLFSAEVEKQVPDGMIPLGRQDLRHIDGGQEVFTLET
ncbi:MAG: DUF427 domain-containing protein [Alphaproteobacteria bacterium]|jgi:class 3 adenylate cyclase/uncharacterized protein (DUF427 family)|nr:DUF427 domain-containing protein [Alphaproteobacteria bacterium]MDP6813312.1 DUF427 domain-containing protein [Alphaproteobacteria bacterium]